MFRLTVLAACLCASASLAAEPVRLALPGLTGIQVSPEVSDFYSEHLAQQLNFQGMRGPAPEVPAPQSPVPSLPARRWDVPLAHTAGLVVGMRASLSLLWPRHYDPSRLREGFSHLREAYTRPPEFHRDLPLLESDGDPWLLNAVGHGLFGSEIYSRARHCGQSPAAAFLATFLASTAWEYTLEAFHQRPSAVDLVWTPLAGALLGEGRYRLHRALVQGGGQSPGAARKVLFFVVDPLGEAERRLLGAGC
ncbi:DUF3943 domain-containing protein [Archangium lipolyticum]|uniref:DUF3943 domain-containing protein n=1 Tax=Archangium lipolyticum TaxID=2970465 RepID=UPI002149C2B6|nr:DUF3943 domain-containing protein [Archangium lipolyticum]